MVAAKKRAWPWTALILLGAVACNGDQNLGDSDAGGIDASAGMPDASVSMPDASAGVLDAPVGMPDASTDTADAMVSADAWIPTACDDTLYLPGSLTLVTNADVAAVASITRISGDLIVDGASVTDLTLPNLSCVDGDVFINSNTSLQTISLAALVRVEGSLAVQFNASLTALSLANVEFLGLALSVIYDEALATIDAGALRSAPRIKIQRTALANMSGFGSLELVGAGGLHLSGNPIMTSMALPSLHTIEGTLKLETQTAMTDLSGLTQLQSVGHLSISKSPSVASIAGLSNLTTLGGLGLLNLPNLNNIDALSGIANNSMGEVQLYETGVVNLNGFPAAVQTVDGFFFENNPALTDVSGLNGINEVTAWVLVANNDALSALEFANLKLVGEGFYVVRNQILASLGFPLLEEIGDVLRIDDNPNLLGLGLSALLYLGKEGPAGTGFNVENNSMLPTCEVQTLSDLLVTNGYTGPINNIGNAPCP